MSGNENTSTAGTALDKRSEAGLQRLLRSLPERRADCVRVFERSDYYSLHEEDAYTAAQIVFRTSTAIKFLGGTSAADGGVPSVSLSEVQFRTLLRELLLRQQKCVELWPADPGARAPRLQASPGNLQAFEEQLFGEASATDHQADDLVVNPVAMAVRPFVVKGQIHLGIAYGDATARTMGLCEITDSIAFNNLQSLAIQIGARECILPNDANSFEVTEMSKVLSAAGIHLTATPKASFNAQACKQDFARLASKDSSNTASAAADLEYATHAATALITYLGLLRDESLHHQMAFSVYQPKSFMRLDASAIRALGLFPAAGPGGAGGAALLADIGSGGGPALAGDSINAKTASLFGLLNRCRSAHGSRLLARWLKQPLLCPREINTRLDIVECLMTDTSLRQAVQDDFLRSVPDLTRLMHKFVRAAIRRQGKAGAHLGASLQDVVRLYQVIKRLPVLQDVLNRAVASGGMLANATSLNDGCGASPVDSLRAGVLKPLEDLLPHFTKLLELVEFSVDLAAVENGEFLIHPQYDSELSELRKSMDATRRKIDRLFHETAASLGLDPQKKVKLDQNTLYGFHMRVTKADAGRLRGKARVLELSTQKSGTLFTTAEMRQLSGQYTEYFDLFEQKQILVVADIISVASTYASQVIQLADLLAQVDVLAAFADAAVTAPSEFVRPQVVPADQPGARLTLTGSRHPCVEAQPDVSFIPNDLDLARAEADFVILTGPNMGGKSTFIRQVGIIVLMAQVGCFVPCSFAQVPVRDAILARVGAGDAQLKGISTFMAEMLETASILQSATSESLIIVDELGRGTSTYDGFGLAWAISEHIARDLGAFCLFATHFHELTALADELPNVRNFHVSAYTGHGSITLLYRVQPGFCDQSFGIHVAEMAKFPAHVVALAKRKASELEDFGGHNEMDRKRKYSKDDIDAGQALIRTFLDGVAGLPADLLHQADASPAGLPGDTPPLPEGTNHSHDAARRELVGRLAALSEPITASDNPYVKDILHTL